MSAVIDAPAPAAGAPEPQVRDRADVRRQVKLIVVFAILLAAEVWFKLDINDPTVSHLLKGPRT